jgi:hypothetical protein
VDQVIPAAKTCRLERVKKLAAADSVPLFEDVALFLHVLCWLFRLLAILSQRFAAVCAALR